MSLFSFLRKNKQESTTDDSTFHSRAEEESKAVRSRRRGTGGRTTKSGEAADPVLPEKKRARRRLIGAVALVLAAVVGLPMILDSEPKPLDDDIIIQIPSKDKPAAVAAAKPLNPAAALDEQEEVLEQPPAAAKSASTDAAEPAVAANAEQKPEAADKPAPVAPPVAKFERKPEPRPENKPETKIDNKPANDGDDARARALLEGKPDPKADKKDSGKFVIQVAALATKEKVNELQARLRDAGIKSYTQTVATDSGSRTRIRVGPFANKDEAEKVRARIVKLGLNGTLVPA